MSAMAFDPCVRIPCRLLADLKRGEGACPPQESWFDSEEGDAFPISLCVFDETFGDFADIFHGRDRRSSHDPVETHRRLEHEGADRDAEDEEDPASCSSRRCV